MSGSVLVTGANGSLAQPMVTHLLTTYPAYTPILTVRDASPSDPNTASLRSILSRFPNSKASIHELDLSSLASVHSFASSLASDIAAGKYPPLAAIICNAYTWNLVSPRPDPTVDGYDETVQVIHVSHAALVMRLLGSFRRPGEEEAGREGGRVVMISSDSHYPGKNPMEVYPPTLGDDLDLLVHPPPLADGDDDVVGKGYQRYANGKLALTTWGLALGGWLEKHAPHISSLLIDAGNFPSSRALTRNTPRSMHAFQEEMMRKPMAELLALNPTVRTTEDGARDVVKLALNDRFRGVRSGFYSRLERGESSPESRDEGVQGRLWEATMRWTGVEGMEG
ncbi:putative short-chain dehydrogenase [Coniochaeta sp. 2T2.1]|nr:putative short-chain dehydrogenase [Coniochaeta sp. 2T2.1]